MTYDADFDRAEMAWLAPPLSFDLCECCDLPPGECMRDRWDAMREQLDEDAYYDRKYGASA